MFTVIGFAVACTLAVDEGMRALAADVRLALRRADITLDFVHHCTGISIQRLSNQLSAKETLTVLCRMLAHREVGPALKAELLDIWADQIDRAVVTRDLGDLVAGVRAIVGGKRAMAKSKLANAPTARAEAV